MRTDIISSTDECEMHAVMKERYKYDELRNVSSQPINTIYFKPY